MSDRLNEILFDDKNEESTFLPMPNNPSGDLPTSSKSNKSSKSVKTFREEKVNDIFSTTIENSTNDKSKSKWTSKSKFSKPMSDIDRLMHNLEVIFRHESISYRQYMIMYDLVYNICTTSDRMNNDSQSLPLTGTDGNKMSTNDTSGQAIYNKLETFLKDKVSKILEECLTSINSNSSSLSESNSDAEHAILVAYNDRWNRFLFSKRVLNGVAQYLNKYWISRMQDEVPEYQIYEIKSLALIIWKKELFDKVPKILSQSILRLVYRDRVGEKVDHTLIKGVTDSFVQLGIDSNNDKSNYKTETSSGTITSAFLQNSKVTDRLSLQVYVDHLENSYLDELTKYYVDESLIYLKDHSIVEYMKHAELRLEQERNRVNSFMHNSSLSSVMNRATTALVKDHLDKIHNEFKPLLDTWFSNNGSLDDLHRMYKLAKECDGLTRMRCILADYIKQRGIMAINNIYDEALVDPKIYVSTIVDLHSRMQSLVVNAFNHDTEFKCQCLNKGFETFINENKITQVHGANKPAELLSKFCDIIMKKGTGILNKENGTNKHFDDAMTIFSFLQDKDVFKKHYETALSKRLILSATYSDDDEMIMITKLKEHSGFEYVNHMNRMFQDKEKNKVLNEQYNAWLKKSNVNQVEVGVQLLSYGQWPITPKDEYQEFNWLPPFSNCITSFKKYHSENYEGRKLSWINHMCKADVISTCFKARHIFTCSIFEATILLLFNDKCSMTIQEITTLIGINKNVLDQVLYTLIKSRLLKIEKGQTGNVTNTQSSSGSHPQLQRQNQTLNSMNVVQDTDTSSMIAYSFNNNFINSPDQYVNQAFDSSGIFEKRGSIFDDKSTKTCESESASESTTSSKNYSPSDILHLNLEYKNKRTRVTINKELRSEAKIEQQQTNKAITDDRKNEIHCCLVRIMKARKRLEMNNLVTEAISQLSHRFKPQIPMIKKSIEQMIEKEYMERDSNDSKILNYVA